MQAAATRAVFVSFEPYASEVIARRARLLGRQPDRDPAEDYARALRMIRHYLVQLKRLHEVSEALPPPRGILYKFFVDDTLDQLVLALPENPSEFTYGQRTLFEDIFQNRLLFRPYLDQRQGLILEGFDDGTPTDDLLVAATDYFYLLQLLFPGMPLIGYSNDGGHGSLPQERSTRICRGVPPARWIQDNELALVHIFESEYFQAFHEGAMDRSRATWRMVYEGEWVRLSILCVDGLLMQTRGRSHDADLDFNQVKFGDDST